MKRNYLMAITSVHFGFVPFCWLWPRVDETVCDTTVFIGPFRMGWINP